MTCVCVCVSVSVSEGDTTVRGVWGAIVRLCSVHTPDAVRGVCSRACACSMMCSCFVSVREVCACSSRTCICVPTVRGVGRRLCAYVFSCHFADTARGVCRSTCVRVSASARCANTKRGGDTVHGVCGATHCMYANIHLVITVCYSLNTIMYLNTLCVECASIVVPRALNSPSSMRCARSV
jgi:hypothetical protein